MEKSPEPRAPCGEGALPWGAGVWGLRTSMDDVPLSPTRSKGWGSFSCWKSTWCPLSVGSVNLYFCVSDTMLLHGLHVSGLALQGGVDLGATC